HLHLFGDLVVSPAHKALDRINSVFRIGNSLALRNLAYKNLACLGERNHRRSNSAALFVGNDLGLTSLHNCYNRIRGSKIDTYGFGHELISSAIPSMLVAMYLHTQFGKSINELFERLHRTALVNGCGPAYYLRSRAITLSNEVFGWRYARDMRANSFSGLYLLRHKLSSVSD